MKKINILTYLNDVYALFPKSINGFVCDHRFGMWCWTDGVHEIYCDPFHVELHGLRVLALNRDHSCPFYTCDTYTVAYTITGEPYRDVDEYVKIIRNCIVQARREPASPRPDVPATVQRTERAS